MVWLFIIVVGNVVFMNFIIAVVNQSYENCIMRMVAHSYKVKVDMIIERESQMNEEDLNNTEFFPKFILLRRVAKGGDDGGDEQQWQGLVK